MRPVLSSVRPLRSRVPVRAMPSGGYERASMIPNPNDPMEALKRANPNLQYGTTGPSPFALTGQGGTNPTMTATGESALSRNLGLEQRGRDFRQQYEQDRMRERPFSPIRTVAPTIGADALTEALFEAGADRVRVPGLSTNDGVSDQEKMRRMDYLRAQDLNRYGRAYS